MTAHGRRRCEVPGGGRGLAIAMVFAIVACGPIGGEGRPAASTLADGSPSNAPIDASSGGDEGRTSIDGSVPDPVASDASRRVAPGGYFVEGGGIFTAAGAVHRFHGLNRPSLEWNAAGENLSQSDFALIQGWRANVVRLPLNQDFWLVGPHHAAGYEHVVQVAIGWAEGLGMDVILDLHWSDRGDVNNQPAQQRMADPNSIAFWKAVADQYKGDGRVIFELYNEPHDVSWDVWRSGGPSGDGFTAVGMQQLYDAVRSTGADNLVIVGGLRFAFDLSTIGQAPIAGYNIAYATHPYDQTDKQLAAWNDAWGYLTARAPVIVTEFGSLKTCSGQYNSDLIAYADAHGASWVGWAWYPRDCTFPSLIADWQGTPTTAGAPVKTALSTY